MDDAGMAAAGRAVTEAHAALADAHQRGSHVLELVEQLRSLGRENHISERFERAVREGFREGGRANGG